MKKTTTTVKLNMQFEGVCPHCTNCKGLAKAELQHFACAEDCGALGEFSRQISKRQQELYVKKQERRKRNEIRSIKERMLRTLKLSKELQWKEEPWFKKEFPKQYAAGWTLKRAEKDGEVYWLHQSGDQKFISTRTPLSANALWCVDLGLEVAK